MPDPYNPWATPIFPGASAFGVGSPAETAERQPTIVDNLLSHIAGALGRGFMAPGQALQSTTPITSEQMIAPAQDMTSAMISGGMPMAEKGAAGVFGGRLAQTADQAALAKAEQLHAAGAPREQIWNDTGWFKGADDKWRFEIPDYHSQMNQKWHDQGVPNSDASLISGQLWHKPLYSAYPDARRIEGLFEKGVGEEGAYRASGASGQETINFQGANAPAARSVALHEIQHAIQEREGFARGGSPSMFRQGDDAVLSRTALAYRRELADIDPHLSPKQKDDIVRKRYADAGAEDWFPKQEARDIAHDVEGNPAAALEKVMQLYGTNERTTPFSPRQLYQELPGEIEARNVQYHKDMTPAELKATPPWVTQDIAPRSIMEQIFGSGHSGMYWQKQ